MLRDNHRNYERCRARIPKSTITLSLQSDKAVYESQYNQSEDMTVKQITSLEILNQLKNYRKLH